jgi:hypothetical protein
MKECVMKNTIKWLGNLNQARRAKVPFLITAEAVVEAEAVQKGVTNNSII